MKKSQIKFDEGKIYEAMEKMPTRDVLILYLRFMKEMTLHEIGRRVMLSHEAVRLNLKRITKELEESGLPK